MRLRSLGLFLGPALFILLLLTPAPAGMSPAAHRVAALASWMAVWWLTTAVPLEVTALLPLALLPLLGVGTIDHAAAPYANSVIFLFLGGFFIAAAMERWHLHKRLAFAILGVVGTDARRVVLAFMLATAFLSMWISNTAAAVMMLPMAMAVLRLAREAAGEQGGADAPTHRRTDAPTHSEHDARRERNLAGLGTSLALGVAYAASIGGVATLIGTPPNAIYAAAAKQLYGVDIGFARWMATGLPIAALLLPICWLLLTRLLHRTAGPIAGLAERLAAERATLGSLEGAERLTLWVFVCAALAWIAREPKALGAVTIPGLQTVIPGISDAGIAVVAALLLFAVPLSLARHEFALDWATASRVPWGILLLFGGGLSLAAAFQTSGLSEWIGRLIGAFADQPRLVVVAAVCTVFVALTELTSNTAIAAMAMPLLAGIAQGLGQPPLLLMQVAALSVSMAFVLPVSTPPNAVVFASGQVTVGQMARAGALLDLAAIVLVTILGTWFIRV